MNHLATKLLKLFPKNRVRQRTRLPFKLRARSLTMLVLAVLLLVGLVRVGWIIAFHGEEYRAKAEQNQLYDTEISAMRGTIYDRNMTPLVTSSSAWILCVNPQEISKFFERNTANPETEYITYCKWLGKQVAKALSRPRAEIIEILRKKDKTYYRVQFKVDATQHLALDEIFAADYEYRHKNAGPDDDMSKLQANRFFSYEPDLLRMYPENNFASTVIGVTDNDGSGISGVEKYYNDALSGRSGRVVTAQDAKGRSLDSSFETVFDTTQGSGAVLTIDRNIQYYLENALSSALKSTGAKGTFGIVMDVDTGAVLAMSDKPDFDLNDPRKLQDESAAKELEEYEGTDDYKAKLSEKLYEQWNSFCVTSTYEPGSTFKIFTAAAALEEGIVNLNTTYTCNGAYQVAKDTVIHCANRSGHGYQTLTQGLMNSCNPFFISMGQKMGIDTFYKYFEAFGFTERTGIDVPGEAYPVYHPQEKMSIVDLASTSFGQSVRLSPIQMITAGCAIANGGKLMQPYIVDSIVSPDGNVLSKHEPTVKRQVISEQTAATVRQMMEAVVEGGTGKNAYIEGYRVAGKTATSEKLDKMTAQNRLLYVASFLCFAPADDPQVAILVGVDEPPGEYRGGGILAAPIAKEVMESTLKYLNVEPRYTTEELKSISKTTPSLIGKSIDEARSAASAANLNIKVVGNGSTVLSQVPSAGQTIANKGVIVVYTTAGESSQTVKVPNFVGMTASAVNETAAAYGLNVVMSGPSGTSGATVYQQSIADGTKVDVGTSVTVSFRVTANMDD